MEKSIYTREHAAVLHVLRQARQRSGLTQVALAERIEETQSYVSKIERGELRLDIIQLRTLCAALGLTLTEFVQALERRLAEDA